jgi:predicted SAM-dependent methyltransferase
MDPWAAHLELRVHSDGQIPVPDGWAEEILAIHVLEHVHPSQLAATLAEWGRCLGGGGLLRVHVPDFRALCTAFANEPDIGRRWALMAALNGMYANASVRSPSELSAPADHQTFFDAEILEWTLREAGFEDIRNLTEVESDMHTEGWADLVPRLSLIFTARKPGDGSSPSSSDAHAVPRR